MARVPVAKVDQLQVTPSLRRLRGGFIALAMTQAMTEKIPASD
jgi:hypothetical protein